MPPRRKPTATRSRSQAKTASKASVKRARRTASQSRASAATATTTTTYVVNPDTGRRIQRGGATYTRLVDSGRYKPAQFKRYAESRTASPAAKKQKKQKASATRSRSASRSRSSASRSRSSGDKDAYFTSSARKALSDPHKRWCRCVAHVAAHGGGAYNPYAVCSKSIGPHGSNECLQYYDLDAMPRDEVRALAKLKKTSVKGLYEKAVVARQKSDGTWSVED